MIISQQDDNQDGYTILPNIDGSILISDNKGYILKQNLKSKTLFYLGVKQLTHTHTHTSVGMRKTSVKARLLAEKVLGNSSNT